MWGARIVGGLEKLHCWIFGHDIYDDHRYDFAWCVKCPRKWQRAKRQPGLAMPLLGEFYD